MKTVSAAILFLGLFVSICLADGPILLEDDNDRINYSYGFQLVETLKKQEVDVKPEVLVKGIRDALAGSEPLLSLEDMRTSLKDLQHRSRLAKYNDRKATREKDRREGKEFLAANAGKPGVVTMPSGLQYRVIREGSGKTPGPKDTVTVNYRGTQINGREFASSNRDNEPATFKVDGVIRGWTEALQLMKEGAKWELFIPPKLAYGDRGPLEDKTLIYELELISVQPAK